MPFNLRMTEIAASTTNGSSYIATLIPSNSRPQRRTPATVGNLGRSNQQRSDLGRFARVRDWGRDKPLSQLGE